MIYDISQEVFSCQVYPGDPAPEKKVISSMEKGDSYNLSSFSMCAHNGTHIDAPFHFIRDGKTVDKICLDAFVGMAYVAEHQGIVSGDDAVEILAKAKEQNPEAAKRILIKGSAEVSSEAAKVFASSEILLLGNESQTVGPEDAPMEVPAGRRPGRCLSVKCSAAESVRCGWFAVQSCIDSVNSFPGGAQVCFSGNN